MQGALTWSVVEGFRSPFDHARSGCASTTVCPLAIRVAGFACSLSFLQTRLFQVFCQKCWFALRFRAHNVLLYRGNTFAERSGYRPRPRIGAAGFDRRLFTSRTVKLVQPISQIGVMVMAAEKNGQAAAIGFLPRRSPPSPPKCGGAFFPGALLLATT